MEILIEHLICFYIFHLSVIAVVFWYVTKGLKKEIKEDISFIKDEIAVLRKDFSEVREEERRRDARVDRLYEMFIELLKETE